MEQTVFTRPEVSGLLAKTIEARLHTDKTSLPNFDRIVEIQQKYAKVATAPVYIILDPTTDKILGRQDGASSIEVFRDWLQSSLSNQT